MHNSKASGTQRLAAFGLDYLLIAGYALGLTVVSMIIMAWRTTPVLPPTSYAASWPFDLLAFVTLVLPVTMYFAVSESSKRRATWGKRRIGLVVVTSEGMRMSLSRSILRSGVKFLPWQIVHSALFAIPGWPTRVQTIPFWAAVGLVFSLSLALLYLCSLLLSRGGWTLYDRVARSEVRVVPVAHPSPRGAAYYLVWAVWACMLALFLWSYLPISSPAPLAEDWYTVPLVTGHHVDLAGWLWEQNNEHRMPVARLVLLGALKVSHGDQRAGGLLNLALLAATAAGLILFVRHLRGGITDLGDAFFPLTLLHFGHSVDALFPFQITYVLSLVVIIALGCTLFLPSSVSSPRAAAVAGGSLLLLPLSGFIGLLFVPPLAAYLFYAGWCSRSGARGWRANRPVGSWLLFASTATVVLAALYFVGYQHPWWNPPNPGVVPTLKVVLKVLSLGFGPAAHFWWAPGVAGAVLFLAASCWTSARRLRVGTPDRDYRIGSTVFLVAAIAFAAGTGWGRAGYVPDIGLPLRYVSLVLPAFIASYLTWAGSTAPFAKAVQRGLALTLLLLVPVNTVAGHRLFGDWYHEGMTSLEADLDRGVPIDELAVRHNQFLVHWWTPAKLAEHMRMLQDARVPPFDRAAPVPPMPR